MLPPKIPAHRRHEELELRETTLNAKAEELEAREAKLAAAEFQHEQDVSDLAERLRHVQNAERRITLMLSNVESYITREANHMDTEKPPAELNGESNHHES